MSYAVYFLLRYPETFRSLREEVRSAFDRIEDITHSKLANLPYLNAAIQEGTDSFFLLSVVLRMRPPVISGLQRVSPKGGAKINGYYISEGV